MSMGNGKIFPKAPLNLTLLNAFYEYNSKIFERTTWAFLGKLREIERKTQIFGKSQNPGPIDLLSVLKNPTERNENKREQ